MSWAPSGNIVELRTTITAYSTERSGSFRSNCLGYAIKSVAIKNKSTNFWKYVRLLNPWAKFVSHNITGKCHKKISAYWFYRIRYQQTKLTIIKEHRLSEYLLLYYFFYQFHRYKKTFAKIGSLRLFLSSSSC